MDFILPESNGNPGDYTLFAGRKRDFLPGRTLDARVTKKPIKLILRNFQSPGDIVMMTAALRDLHKTYPGWFLTDVRTSCPAIFENNPYITPLSDDDLEVIQIQASYDLIHRSNSGAYHFIHGFIMDLEERLGIRINVTEQKGDIHISELEKSWFSQIREISGRDIPYWIINAGCKNDFTCKLWEMARYQAVVDHFPQITFVQIGAKEHNHLPLVGPNVINLIGKTDLRQLIRLVYHSAGVITPVSLPMHLAAAIEVHPRYRRKTRPCIVIAGGREPSSWEAYTNHLFLHTCGMLPCCDLGGCWCSRIEPLGDGDEKDTTNLCRNPVVSESGQKIPKCMDMITVDQVCQGIRDYLDSYDYYYA